MKQRINKLRSKNLQLLLKKDGKLKTETIIKISLKPTKFQTLKIQIKVLK